MVRPFPQNGVPRPAGEKGRFYFRSAAQGGFTLFEMLFVLLIIAILAGVTMPSFHSAMVEQAVRKDSHQLALMVRTAMLQSSEQHRAYVIDISGQSVTLHPLGEVAATETDATANLFNDSATASDTPTLPSVQASMDLDADNKLQSPDLDKADSWVAIPDTSWTFQPGELCPATSVRLQRGDSWLEMSFSALTGNVENEKTSFQ